MYIRRTNSEIMNKKRFWDRECPEIGEQAKIRLKNAKVINVADFTLDYPHERAYLTVTSTNCGDYELGTVGMIEEMSTEEMYIIVQVWDRPDHVDQAVAPRTYKFIFASREDMISFVNRVMISGRMYE